MISPTSFAIGRGFGLLQYSDQASAINSPYLLGLSFFHEYVDNSFVISLNVLVLKIFLILSRFDQLSFLSN